ICAAGRSCSTTLAWRSPPSPLPSRHGSRAAGSAISGSPYARAKPRRARSASTYSAPRWRRGGAPRRWPAAAAASWPSYSNNLFPSRVFDINRSIELILAPVVGGLGTVFGPVVGAFILTPLGEALTALTDWLGINAPGVKGVFYGAALMAIIVLKPSGVWPW